MTGCISSVRQTQPHPEPIHRRDHIKRGFARNLMQSRKTVFMKAIGFLRLLLCAIFMVILTSCDSHHTNTKSMSNSREELLKITRDYLQKEQPTWVKSLDLPPIITEHQDYWEVSFKLPDDMIGGVPVVEVDKASFRVRKAYHTQ